MNCSKNTTLNVILKKKNQEPFDRRVETLEIIITVTYLKSLKYEKIVTICNTSK